MATNNATNSPDIDGGTLTGVTAVSDDKIIIQDTSDNNKVKTVEFSDVPASDELNRRVRLTQTNVAANSNTTFTLVSDISNYYKVTFTSSCTIAFTFPSAEVTSMCVELINAGAFTVTFPVGLQWPGGTAPTFTVSGKDIIVVWNNGDNVNYATLIGQDFS